MTTTPKRCVLLSTVTNFVIRVREQTINSWWNSRFLAFDGMHFSHLEVILLRMNRIANNALNWLYLIVVHSFGVRPSSDGSEENPLNFENANGNEVGNYSVFSNGELHLARAKA